MNTSYAFIDEILETYKCTDLKILRETPSDDVLKKLEFSESDVVPTFNEEYLRTGSIVVYEHEDLLMSALRGYRYIRTHVNRYGFGLIKVYVDYGKLKKVGNRWVPSDDNPKKLNPFYFAFDYEEKVWKACSVRVWNAKIRDRNELLSEVGTTLEEEYLAFYLKWVQCYESPSGNSRKAQIERAEAFFTHLPLIKEYHRLLYATAYLSEDEYHLIQSQLANFELMLELLRKKAKEFSATELKEDYLQIKDDELGNYIKARQKLFSIGFFFEMEMDEDDEEIVSALYPNPRMLVERLQKGNSFNEEQELEKIKQDIKRELLSDESRYIMDSFYKIP